MRASLLSLSLGLTAAAALWAFLVNRVVLNHADGTGKTLAEVALALGLGGLAVWSAWRWSRRSTHVSLAILALFAVGEVRRVLLRSEYGKRFEIPTLSQVLNPVTTTELSLQHFAVRVPALAAARVRVVHVSDLHVTGALPWSYFTGLHTTIQKLEPDLIVMTGDYVSHADRIELFARWLEGLPHAQFGTFATLGNHDYWSDAQEDVRAALGRAGVHVIAGVCESVAAGSVALRLCGTDEPWGPALPESAIQNDGALLIALTHTPDNVYALRELGVSAVFAGHTHGGQMRLPGLGALVVPSRFGRRFDRGHFVVDGTHLFVSAGVGADAPPVRLWCPPELVTVDLAGSEALAARE